MTGLRIYAGTTPAAPNRGPIQPMHEHDRTFWDLLRKRREAKHNVT